MKQFVNKSIELGNWGLSIVWNLVLGIWDLTNKGVKMGKIILFAFVSFVVLVSLCFGYGDVLKTEAKPSLIWDFQKFKSLYLSQRSDWNNSMIRKISFCQNPLQFNTMLMMQVEGESLQPENSFWKQAGIYGLEFVGAGTTTLVCYWVPIYLFNLHLMPEPEDFHTFLTAQGCYIVSNTLLSSSATAIIGKLFNQKGSWKKAAVGVFVGSLVHFASHWAYEGGEHYYYISFALPPIGAVVGYNW